MAIVANTFLTFSSIGNREDLRDQIYNISPVEVPFQSMTGGGSVKATFHEWQTDTLAAAGANAQLQGDDITFAAVTPTTRVGNRTQISFKTCIISGTQEAIDKAGRKGEMVYQLNKRSKELKRDREFILLSNQAPVTGNSTTAPQLRPVLSWFATNVSSGVGAANGSATTARTDGTQRTFTETLVQDMQQSAYMNGGDPTLLLCGPKQRRVISGFTGGATKFDKTEDKTLYATVEVYVGDFGRLSIVTDRFMRGAATGADREVMLLDRTMWETPELRPMKTVDLAKTGDAEKALVICEYTLVSKNEAGSALIADLT